MDKQLRKELKKILTGRVIVGQDGMISALSDSRKMVFHGVTDGWESVQLNGITSRDRWFRVAENGGSVFEMMFSAMQNLGRLVELTQSPDTLACIRRYVLFKPVVIAVDYEGDGIVHVTVYTGKSLLAGMSCRRGLKDFCRALPPDRMDPVEVRPRKKQTVQKKEAEQKKTTVGKKSQPKRLQKKKGKREL